jgi:hypothetical protein
MQNSLFALLLGLVMAREARSILLLSVAVATSACQDTVKAPVTSGPEPRFLVIGAIRSNLLAEQEELYITLKAHNIKMSLDGSKLFDILVEEGKADRALEILRTNPLVLDKKVFLSPQPRRI